MGFNHIKLKNNTRYVISHPLKILEHVTTISEHIVITWTNQFGDREIPIKKLISCHDI
jgi:hypothetical protein